MADQFDDAKHHAGLVRVVALDGSVWWTLPVHAAYYAALATAMVPKK